MVLLLAHSEDPLARAVQARLWREGVRAVLAAASRPVSSVHWTWRPRTGGPEGALEVDGQQVALSALSGVLAREHAPFVPEPGMSEADAHYVRAEVRASLLALLEALPCFVANRPSAPVARRPFLFAPGALDAVRAVGLHPPEALVTPDTDEAARFVGEGRFLVGSLRGRAAPQAAAGEPLDVLLRARVPACVIRVPDAPLARLYVVGPSLAAAEWQSEPGSPWHPWEAPPPLVDRAVSLVGRLGLGFARVTLALAGAGTCLDVEPCPRLEDAADGVTTPLTEALARRLAGEGRAA
ncbi:hypothetical protein OV207_23095 [Corallococcus sp. BB11-1]|uniref:hypothetical protein n=1 Tax=Corallococcus sp. BB11-1 TaxID=2996783 RepID=UPI00227059D7|nr:hypothetical protein [Corallococcus sp. BB11-1]MCY1034358.1 hypothetical protein [Corallococcus sp. BB11-1]